MTNTNEELSKRIEQMVVEHIAATRKAALAAMERAFTSAGAGAATPVRATRKRTPGKRRGGTELAALGERFLQALGSKPGEKMAVLAAEVGASPRELHRAVARLKEDGRVRAVGERAQTRYFPMASNGAE